MVKHKAKSQYIERQLRVILAALGMTKKANNIQRNIVKSSLELTCSYGEIHEARELTDSIAKAKRKVVAKPAPKVDKPRMGLAVAALLINAFLLPGLGTILGGRTRPGILQLIMIVGGLILGIAATMLAIPAFFVSQILGLFLVFLVMVGGVIIIIGWIWAIISGALLIRKATS